MQQLMDCNEKTRDASAAIFVEIENENKNEFSIKLNVHAELPSRDIFLGVRSCAIEVLAALHKDYPQFIC